MKTFKLLSIFTIIFSFSQCASLQLENNSPFKVITASFINWSGGQQGVKGMNVEIHYSSNKTIEFDKIYFEDKVANLEVKPSSKNKLVVGFFSDNSEFLDTDKKEFFNLNKKEAIISYKEDNKLKYYKIKEVKQGKQVFYPSAPKQ